MIAHLKHHSVNEQFFRIRDTHPLKFDPVADVGDDVRLALGLHLPGEVIVTMTVIVLVARQIQHLQRKFMCHAPAVDPVADSQVGKQYGIELLRERAALVVHRFVEHRRCFQVERRIAIAALESYATADTQHVLPSATRHPLLTGQYVQHIITVVTRIEPRAVARTKPGIEQRGCHHVIKAARRGK